MSALLGQRHGFLPDSRAFKLYMTAGDVTPVDESITVISQDRLIGRGRAERRGLDGKEHVKSIGQKHSALSGRW